jgi:hypothetical protein
MTGKFDAVHVRHANIDQYNVTGLLLHQRQRLTAVSGFANHRGRHFDGDVTEQIAQPGARRRFVVEQQQAQGRIHRVDVFIAPRRGREIR